MEGLMLGLSSGTACLVHCAPVIIPYFLGEGGDTTNNILNLVGFLAGRLLGYILISILAWMVGQTFINSFEYREVLIGVIFILLSLTMFFYGMFRSNHNCVAKPLSNSLNRLVLNKRLAMNPLLGFLTGINFCPPFLLAFTSSAFSKDLSQSISFFLMFFLGTSIYLFPTVFIGFVNISDNMKTIGKMTALIMSFYFIYKGIVMILGGC